MSRHQSASVAGSVIFGILLRRKTNSVRESFRRHLYYRFCKERERERVWLRVGPVMEGKLLLHDFEALTWLEENPKFTRFARSDAN